MGKILKSTHEGNLNINGFEITAYNLPNGDRVLSRIGFLKALGRTGKAKGGRQYDEDLNLPIFLTAKNLLPLIDQELKENSESIKFIDLNGNESIGYKAELLPMVAFLFNEALDKGILKTNQIHIGQQSKILVKSFLKTSIIALVDEATGYQYERERDELQQILGAYISEELLPWQKRFPDEYYKEIFRLNGWDFTVNGIKSRPSVIGIWTNKLIYKQLPKGVLDELKGKTPKSDIGNYTARFHQSLSMDIGEPHLEKQLVSVITLMRISDNWKDFEFNFNKAYGQQQLFDVRTHEKPKEKKALKPKEDKLSTFNKSLTTALEFKKKDNED